MASDEQLLQALESLMTEFFGTGTTNERKREIENQVKNFGQQQGAWKHCLYFLSQTSNEYVMMYALTILETLINKQWIGMLGDEKSHIRSTLYTFLLTRHRIVPNFISNKLGKLVVDVGRNDWPHFYPDFFSNILQLIQSNDTTSIGLMLLQTASEELAFPRENLCISRKEELHKLMLAQVPSSLTILKRLLENTMEKHRHLVTATPPPSPTHGQADNSSELPLFTSSPLQNSCILSSMFKSSKRNQFQVLPSMDSTSHQLCSQSLNVLAHFFSWVPLANILTSGLLNTMFHFASFGCDPVSVHHEGTNKSELGILAMSCINEIMSKNCVPAHYEEFMLELFQSTFYLLKQITKDNSGLDLNILQTTNSPLANLDENYVEKFTDFLRLFVSSHLRRFDGNPQFPVSEFLSLLYTYTFQQPNLQGFYLCLEIWGTFLDYLNCQMKNRQRERLSFVERGKNALQTLVRDIINKLQFKLNQTALEELDDEGLDDDFETEWQGFLHHCLEIVGKVAELMPLETFQMIYPHFQENLNIYLGLENFVQTINSERHLQVTAENECRRLHCSLRDLSSFLQAMALFANLFIGEHFHGNLSTMQNIMQCLSHSAQYSMKMKFYLMKTAAQTVLSADFIEVHSKILITLKSYCPWLSQYCCEVIQKNQSESSFASLVTVMVESTVPNLTSQTPEKICHSAAHFFLSLTSTVKPSFIFGLPVVQELFNSSSFQGSLYQLPLETQLLIYRSLQNILLLPWPNVADAEQEWTTRSKHYHLFIQSLTSTFKQVCSVPLPHGRNEMKDQAIKWTVRITCDQILNLKEASVRLKQLAYQSFEESIYLLVTMFPYYLNQADVGEEIMDFFFALFDVMKGQMSMSFIEQTVQTFLGLFSRDQLIQYILDEGSSGARIVEKFLKMLQLVVQEPSGNFKSFLTGTIDFCMDHIYPIIAERSSPEVKLPLFELLYKLLLNNWKHFFKNRVVDTLGQSGNETVEHGERLTKIMEAFGQSFLQPDLNVYKHNLEALENLNAKWKLYYKGMFRSVMLNQFLHVLLQTLVHRSHDLLQDEIAITIYNMASVDFDNFYQVFLREFLGFCDGLDDNQKSILARNFPMETDLPTFTQNIHRLINDLRFYQVSNKSLPAGSVIL